MAALTKALQRMIAEGDGEGAQVVLRALEELAELAVGGANRRSVSEAGHGQGTNVRALAEARQKPIKRQDPAR